MGDRIREFYGPLLLYIIGLNILIISAVALLHEFGHAALGYLYGCGDIAVILLDTRHAAYTQMACSESPPAFFRFLSAFLLVAPVSALFFALRPFKERYLGHVILGIGIVMAAADIHALLDVVGIPLLTMLLGAIIAIYGEDRLINGIIATELDITAEKERQQ